MAKNKIDLASKVSFSGFDEMFSAKTKDIPSITVPLTDLYEFEGHPFKVIDEQLTELIESIKDLGVLEPAIVRPRKKGGYEIISGHRRKRACELAGLNEMPVKVTEYDDDDATIIMVDSNLHREVILPSEKAKAYAMKFEKMKHQGKKGNALSDLSESTGEGAKTIQRYICLARCVDGLLDLIDGDIIPFMVGVELSYIPKEHQQLIYDEFVFLRESKLVTKISTDQATMLRNLSDKGNLDVNMVVNVLQATKLPTKPAPFKFKVNRMGHYFKSSTTPETIENTVYELLEIIKANKDNDLFKGVEGLSDVLR